MAKKILRMPSNWRPDEFTLYHPGDYRVPEDWSEDLAARAVDAGVAVVVDDFSHPDHGDAKKPSERTKMKSKGPAPENKSVADQ